RARQMEKALTAELDIGETYEGTVKSTTAFGAFVEIMPGTEGLVHISELKHGRTEKTEDVINKGDRVKVKLLDRDERGRLRLSMKALVPKPDSTDGAATAPAAESRNGDSAGEEPSEEGGSEASARREDRPRRPRSRAPRGGGGRGRE
ncbi:MAG: S1 RNA-binding domain-containing protein, partial [Gemmatimonas sp.]